MGERRTKHGYSIGFFLSIILGVVMVQNFFLVRRVDDYAQHVKGLRMELNRLTVMNPGDSIMAFSAMTLDSTIVVIDLSMRENKKLLLAFTTWCHVCLQNIPQWERLVRGLSQSDITIVGISPDPILKLADYRTKVPISYSVFSIANDSTLIERYKLGSYPQTILVDSGGRVIHVWNGGLGDQDMTEVLRAAS